MGTPGRAGRGKMGEKGGEVLFLYFFDRFLPFPGYFFAVFWIKNPQKDGSVLDPLEFGENLDQNWAFPGILPKFGGAEGDFRGDFGDPKPLPVFPRPIPGFLQLGAPEDNGNPINYRDPIIGIN